MTNRFQYDTYWASGGVATDPDTDTTHALYIADRYATVGWKAEKPPNDWDNYLYQITDAKIIWMLQQSIQEWDSGVSYNSGSLTIVGEVVYKNISGAVSLNKDPTTETSVWQPILELSAGAYQSLVTALEADLGDHLLEDNPHNDTIGGIGGVTKEYLFSALDDDTDPRTIKYHVKQTGRQHGETPAQVGTLPTTGGTFTGDVAFTGKVAFDAGKSAYVQLNKATARAELHLASATLAIDVLGNVYYNDGTTEYLVVTEVNFVAVQNKVNVLFALPQPLAVVDVRADSLSQLGCRPVTLNTVADATWDAVKGLVLVADDLTSPELLMSGNTTAHIIGFNSVGLQSELFDSTTSDYSALGNFLMTTTSSKFTHLQSIAIYPKLTAYQKTTLVNYVTT